MNPRQRRDNDHGRGRHAKNPDPDCFGCAYAWTEQVAVGKLVRVAAPQGSAFDGLIGTVEEVLPFDRTVYVRLPKLPAMPFGPGELKPVAVKPAATLPNGAPR